MSTPFHSADPPHEPAAPHFEPEDDASVPRPLPQDDRHGLRMAFIAILIAIVAIALVILL